MIGRLIDARTALAGLCGVAAMLAAPALAAPDDRLPPRGPMIDYAMVFSFSQAQNGQVESGRRGIAISGTRVRDEVLDGGNGDHRVFIGDKATGTVTAFDPTDPDKKAVRAPMTNVLLPMADGYGQVMQTLGPPRALGSDTVAGRDCTVLRWQIGADRQDWCVDRQGIVLRAVQTVGPIETKFEALTIKTGEQPETLFRLPEGFTVEER